MWLQGQVGLGAYPTSHIMRTLLLPNVAEAVQACLGQKKICSWWKLKQVIYSIICVDADGPGALSGFFFHPETAEKMAPPPCLVDQTLDYTCPGGCAPAPNRIRSAETHVLVATL